MAMEDLIGLSIPGVIPSTADLARLSRSGAMPAASQPQLTPTAKYIADMQALMSGGIGKLSTGEKIAAVGQVLQAAGSRGAVDPASVIQNVRKQQMDKLNAQYQIAQLRQKTLEEENFIKTLTPSERNMFAILDETGRRQFMVARQQGREETDAEKKLRAAGIDPASPQGQKILQNVAASQGVISVTGPAGTTYVQAADVVLGGGTPRPAAQTIPQEAIKALQSGKGTVAQFEEIFGKGSAAQYLGGGSGNATGGFRGR